MTIQQLEPDEIEVIGRALRLMAKGELLDVLEFGTRIGITLEEFRNLLKSWPHWDDSDEHSSENLAINNTLNDILHGLGLPNQILLESIGVDRIELQRIYRKWSDIRGWKKTGIR